MPGPIFADCTAGWMRPGPALSKHGIGRDRLIPQENSSQGTTISYRGRGAGPKTLGEQLKNKAIRLGAAGALAPCSGFAVPGTGCARSCGPIVDSVKPCTDPEWSPYPVLANSPVAAPRPIIGGALLVGNTLTVYDNVWDPPRDAHVPVAAQRRTDPGRYRYHVSADPVGPRKGHPRQRSRAALRSIKATTVQSTKTAAGHGRRRRRSDDHRAGHRGVRNTCDTDDG